MRYTLGSHTWHAFLLSGAFVTNYASAQLFSQDYTDCGVPDTKFSMLAGTSVSQDGVTVFDDDSASETGLLLRLPLLLGAPYGDEDDPNFYVKNINPRCELGWIPLESDQLMQSTDLSNVGTRMQGTMMTVTDNTDFEDSCSACRTPCHRRFVAILQSQKNSFPIELILGLR